MKRTFFIIVPSFIPTGPVKGAIALANQLIETRRVFLVSLKPGNGAAAYIDERVEVIQLWEIASGFIKKILKFRELLNQSGTADELVSVSIGFSSDVVNLFCRDFAIICSSVRGNLPVNYQMDYGFKGRLLAYFHLIMLRRFHVVTAMTTEMANQISKFLGRSPAIVGNFVDEKVLEKFREQPKAKESRRFVFVGSLTARKRPELLIKAVEQLRQQGHEVELDMLGEGPLESHIKSLIDDIDLQNNVHLHGHVDKPYPIIRAANAFVLPSMSEGVSRAAMEALYLGTPCVLRNVDGNRDLIKDSETGVLFNEDGDLPQAMLKASRINTAIDQNLLPNCFRQRSQTANFLKILEK